MGAAMSDLLVESIEVLPDQVIKNVETIISHQDQYRQNATVDQQILDKIAAIFGQPQFLYFQISFFTLWGVYSYLVDRHVLPPYFPLFALREEWLEVSSLLISTGVLIYQNRRETLSAERSHLILQINLLTEQKISKLISLVEELRIDLPNVKNRNDLEAEMMQQATDTQAILGVLQQNLEHPAAAPNSS
jgi:uncharacterized membrane protein